MQQSWYLEAVRLMLTSRMSTSQIHWDHYPQLTSGKLTWHRQPQNACYFSLATIDSLPDLLLLIFISYFSLWRRDSMCWHKKTHQENILMPLPFILPILLCVQLK